MTVGDSALVTCCLHRLRSARPLWVRPGGVCFSAVRCLPGGTGKGIGERLFLGPKTVEGHVTHIFTKLGVGESADDHRRVLAVLSYLRSAPQQQA
jgi:Bacterial regulatory proteins, luxR family